MFGNLDFDIKSPHSYPRMGGWEVIWGSLLNSRHPEPRHVWKGGPELRSVDRIAGQRGQRGLSWQHGWVPKSSKLMVYAVLEHPWLSQKWSEASRGPKCLTHIERSEIPGYKLPGWDATWGTCLEQSLCKMTPRRLKMKNSFVLFSEVRNCLMSWNRKIKTNTVSSTNFFWKSW